MFEIVYYDIEGTGTNSKQKQEGIGIISIGAVTASGNEFKTFMLPTVPISESATAVHGMTVQHGKLIDKNGQEIATESPDIGLKNFLDFLENSNCKYLVAHNNFKYDWHVLKKNLQKFKIKNSIIDQLIPIDSQLFIEEEFHYWPCEDFSVKNCLKEICNEERIESEAHDALNDAKSAKQICEQGAQKLNFKDFLDYITRKEELHAKPNARFGMGHPEFRDFRISRNFNPETKTYYIDGLRPTRGIRTGAIPSLFSR